MGNNQGNQNGAAQDKRARANQVQKGDSKDSKNSARPAQVPREKGGANPGGRGGMGSEPGSTKS